MYVNLMENGLEKCCGYVKKDKKMSKDKQDNLKII